MGFDEGGWAFQPSHKHPHRRFVPAILSMLVLFALAIGQVSLTAIASDATQVDEPAPSAPTEPTVDATADDSTVADDSATSDDVSPTDDVAATDDEMTDDQVTDEAIDDQATEASADSSTNTDSSATSAGATGSGSSEDAATTTTTTDEPGPPSGGGEQPILVAGNPSCLSVMASTDFDFERKHEPVTDATIALSAEGGLSGTLVISVNEGAQTFDFTFTGDFDAKGVIVKGGSNANFYDYRPAGEDADTGLHAPVNPSNGKFFGLSHISFCIGEAETVTALEVTKTCPDEVAFGTEIEYTITITNTGNEDLVDIVVDDPLLGDISGEFDVDLSAGLAVGATATATVGRTPEPGESHVVNTVEVSATGAESDTAVSDEASCETDVITGPAIRLEKGGPDFAHVGDTITYQFAVTNLGTVELFDVDLTDDRCDGTVTPGTDVDASLGVGEVWHFSCTHVVTGDDPDPLENTASVRGDTQAGAGGEEVTDTATHQVDILHPVIMIEKTASPETAAVGATVTYTFVVSNPSADTDLFDVAVTDDRLGAIGIIPILAAGTSETFTVTSEMGTEPVTNIGTASGEDLLGAIVTDTDTATVTPIAGSGGGGNGGGGGAVGGVGGNVGGNVSGAGGGAGAGTAFTGSDTFVWLVIAAVLAAVGLLTLAATRRRKAEGEA